MRPPTDLKILKAIYRSYIADFKKYDLGGVERNSVIYVPIDVERIANLLSIDRHLLFGRLYYDIDYRYRYKQTNDSVVHLFAPKVGKDHHAVNFPLLEGVIARLTEQSLQFWLPLAISSLALGLSLFGALR